MTANAFRFCIYFLLLKEAYFQKMYIPVLVLDTFKVLVLDVAQVLKFLIYGPRLCFDTEAGNANYLHWCVNYHNFIILSEKILIHLSKDTKDFGQLCQYCR